jgi:hypothetical protein
MGGSGFVPPHSFLPSGWLRHLIYQPILHHPPSTTLICPHHVFLVGRDRSCCSGDIPQYDSLLWACHGNVAFWYLTSHMRLFFLLRLCSHHTGVYLVLASITFWILNERRKEGNPVSKIIVVCCTNIFLCTVIVSPVFRTHGVLVNHADTSIALGRDGVSRLHGPGYLRRSSRHWTYHPIRQYYASRRHATRRLWSCGTDPRYYAST